MRALVGQGLTSRIDRAVIASLAVLAAALVGGCGSSDSGGDELATMVPPDAPLYLEATVKPDEDQAQAIDALAGKLGLPADPGDLLVASLDRELSADGMSYSEDIEPWLGAHVALFFRSFRGAELKGAMPDFAALLQTSDSGAAEDFLEKASSDPSFDGEKRTYQGYDYFVARDRIAAGMVGDTLVIGTEASLKAAIDSSKGMSLADADAYVQQIDALPESRPLSAYANLDTIVDATVRSGESSRQEAAAARAVLGPLFEGPMAAAIEVGDSDVALDVALPAGDGLPSRETALLKGLPGDAWAAYGFSDAGEAAQRVIATLEATGRAVGEPGLEPGAIMKAFHSLTGLDLDTDVLSPISDAAAYVRGTGERDFELGLELKTTDPKATARALDALRKPIDALGETRIGPPLRDADAGFSASNPNGSGVFDVELQGNLVKAALASSAATIEHADETGELGDSEAFKTAAGALGGDYSKLAFLDFAKLVNASGALSEVTGPIDPIAEQVLRALSFGVVGARPNGDGLVTRDVVGVNG
jgi:hypothetical protein